MCLKSFFFYLKKYIPAYILTEQLNLNSFSIVDWFVDSLSCVWGSAEHFGHPVTMNVIMCIACTFINVSPEEVAVNRLSQEGADRVTCDLYNLTLDMQVYMYTLLCRSKEIREVPQMHSTCLQFLLHSLMLRTFQQFSVCLTCECPQTTNPVNIK